MKIALLTTNSHLGGAAVVTLRLAEALHEAGHQATVVAANVQQPHPRVVPAGKKAALKAAFLAEHAEIFLRNGLRRSDLFKVSTARFGIDLSEHPAVREADVILLSWVNQGMLSLKGVRRLASLGKPVVWMMHDMWNITGLCHHSSGCSRFQGCCGRCPLLHWEASSIDLSHARWDAKYETYRETPITFVAVSSWLQRLAQASSLLAHSPVRVIPNPLDVESYITAPTASRQELGLPEKGKIILMGAARLDDPIKGLPIAVEALNSMQTPDAVAVFFGDLRDAGALKDLKRPHVHLGPVNDPERLRQIYASADVVMCPSLYETLPTTLIEGQAAGCTAVGFGGDGRDDIIFPGISGYLAQGRSPQSLAKTLDLAVTAPLSRDALHTFALRRFSAPAVAQRYISLFNELLKPEK